MSDAQVLELAQGAMLVALKLAGPLLAVSLVVGIAVSLFQAVTQIQEASLSFVPKVIGIAVVALVAGHWMLDQLVGWCRALWTSIPTLLS